MLMSKDLLKEHPWSAVCNMINNRFNYGLNPYTTTLVSFTHSNDSKVYIKIDRKLSKRTTNSLPILENKSFSYNRLPLNYIVTTSSVIDGVVLPVNSHEALQELVKVNDWVITQDDVEPLVLSDYSQAYTLKAAPNSLRFYGSITVTVNNTNRKNIADYTISSFPNVHALDNSANLNKFNGSFLTTTYDFSIHREYLRTVGLKARYTDASYLSSLLSSATDVEFKGSSVLEDYNITSKIEDGMAVAEVLYNGLVIPGYSERRNATHVLVIKINPTYCSNILGTLLIHYN